MEIFPYQTVGVEVFFPCTWHRSIATISVLIFILFTSRQLKLPPKHAEKASIKYRWL